MCNYPIEYTTAVFFGQGNCFLFLAPYPAQKYLAVPPWNPSQRAVRFKSIDRQMLLRKMSFLVIF